MNLGLHGASPNKLFAQFGIEKPSEIIDFSTNTNVIKFDNDISVNIDSLICNYPDDECLLLRQIIAQRENCNIENILITNGSNEGIYLLASYQNSKKIGILQPTYTEYEKAVLAFGANVEYFYGIEDIESALDVVFICNPCNPTGKYIEADIIENYIKCYQKTLFIIDEAYIDFVCSDVVVIDFNKYNNVYILRSLTKIYHLSGIRIGYVLSSKDNIINLKQRQPTWSVNSVAQAIAIKYLSSQSFLLKTKEFYKNEKQRMVSKLEKLGFKIDKSDVNFFLLKTKDDISLIKFLLSYGLVVRHTRNFPSLDGKYIRISIREPFENDILIDKLEEYIKAEG